MLADIYRRLRWKIILLTMLVTFTPLFLLGVIMYRQFAGLYTEKVREQISVRALAQAEALDLFLKERTAILGAIAETHTFQTVASEENLARKLDTMNRWAGAFVDLGVIDADGRQLAYVGPYDLRGRNYGEQQWFAEVMSKGVYVSDVYLGFRKVPHFIIAVRRQENQRTWILRATIDSEIFGRIVQGAMIGKTGDAFLVGEEGLLQTRPRFGGGILDRAPVNVHSFGKQTTTFEEMGTDARNLLVAGTWLKTKPWLLAITVDIDNEMAGLFATRTIQIAIIAAGVLAIVFTTVFTTRLMVEQLIRAETRVKEMNAQLMQSDKLAALGKMAAGVAHEINNPLAVILQKTGWIQDLLDEDDLKRSPNYQEFRSSLGKIEEHVERARKVVHNMLGYARRMEPRNEDVRINETIDQTVGILENFARTNSIDIQTDLAEDIPVIAGDPAQVQQVILNLVTNAIDAIGHDGTVAVRSRRTKSEIHVSVADTGPGIPENLQRIIFDPFYTTKSAGKGTGLGLWISYNIIEKMGGRITLQSRMGHGAEFTIQLPIVPAAAK